MSPSRRPGPPGIRERGELLFSRDMKLLTLFTRLRLDQGHQREARELLRGVSDWAGLIRLARRHNLEPLLAHHLHDYADCTPDAVRRQVAEGARLGACRVLERTAQLLEVLSAFRGSEIPAVPYKGPALAVQLYGNVALRPAGDLDILVRRSDAPEARRALAGLGYRSRHDLDPKGVRFLIRHRYHEEFDRADGGHVELHWAFTNRDFPFPLELDELLPRLVDVEVSGHAVQAFGWDDLLLILSVHGAKHRWDRLEWLGGLARLLRISTDLNWERILDRSSRMGVKRALLLGLLLAYELLDAPVPEEILRQAREDRNAPILAARAVELLSTAPRDWGFRETVRRDRFRYRLIEGWPDRARFLWHRATTPSDPGAWEIARVGPWHVPVHAIRRPFQLVGRLVLVASGLMPGAGA